jgi:lysophospholipase L1-like esterase
MNSTHAPGVVYENVSVPGAVTSGVASGQLAGVTTGPGHVMVVFYAGGNDLAQFLTQSDANASAGFNAKLPELKRDWNTVVSFFTDANNFPDGATLIMNNQYNPFDDCTAPPYNLGDVKTGILATFNAEMAAFAEANDVTLTDQFTPFLGHGHHHQVDTCPHYKAGSELWLADLIHPNALGHANLAHEWSETAKMLYESCE